MDEVSHTVQCIAVPIAVVRHNSGHTLLGHWRTISSHLKHLVEEQSISPDRIAQVFTSTLTGPNTADPRALRKVFFIYQA